MRARLSVAIDGGGVRRLDREPPLCAYTRVAADGATELWLVSSGATLLEGDELSVELSVRDGAVVRARSVAAQLVHPCPDGGSARWEVSVTVADGAQLCWWPEPTVIAAGARYHAQTACAVGASASLHWCEELVLGRTGDAATDCVFHTATRIDVDGHPVLRDGLTSGAPAWQGPAVLGDARYVGSRVMVNAADDQGAVHPQRWWPLAQRGSFVRRVLSSDPLTGRAELAGC